ncbi:hypothetical protein TNCV_244421 [Trichonephila clavipes]|uniref:Uncharacterized protein n=1 Tax=Trichonephila clavipes TaxID=2585209 RepID=A0A8X6RLZ4_TRICX|nr:hypothetical protein TNCV_244421 [Trichonephila clavipes]
MGSLIEDAVQGVRDGDALGVSFMTCLQDPGLNTDQSEQTCQQTMIAASNAVTFGVTQTSAAKCRAAPQMLKKSLVPGRPGIDQQEPDAGKNPANLSHRAPQKHLNKKFIIQ